LFWLETIVIISEWTLYFFNIVQKLLYLVRMDQAFFCVVDGVFSFIGGKMEHKDLSIIDALSREKTEEVGELFRIKVLPHYSIDTFFVKKDGSRMILPHYYAVHQSGEINLSEEYDDYRWVPLNSLDEFEPKIENIAWIATLLSRAATIAEDEDFVAV